MKGVIKEMIEWTTIGSLMWLVCCQELAKLHYGHPIACAIQTVWALQMRFGKAIFAVTPKPGLSDQSLGFRRWNLELRLNP